MNERETHGMGKEPKKSLCSREFVREGMSGKDSTKGEDRGRVKEQGRAEVCPKKEVVGRRFKEDWRGDSSST